MQLLLLAEWTGLEPATPGVTGRYSNQLNYHSGNRRRGARPGRYAKSGGHWWVLTGSNRRHSPCKGDALPAELSTRAASLSPLEETRSALRNQAGHHLTTLGI